MVGWRLEVEPELRQSQLLSWKVGSDSSGDSQAGTTFATWHYILANAAAWPALALVLRSYIRRRSGRKVVVYGDNGQKLLEVTGDLSTAEIEALLKARVAPPELGGTAAAWQEAPSLGDADPEPDNEADGLHLTALMVRLPLSDVDCPLPRWPACRTTAATSKRDIRTTTGERRCPENSR